jgi:hypothetical protein
MDNSQMASATVSCVTALSATKIWVEDTVIGLQLCPFAQQARNRIRYRVSEAKQEAALLKELQTELLALQSDDSIETSLLIHPYVLGDFAVYNQFLSIADELLEAMDLVGEIQIASFHPNYQFADTSEHCAENYTNRSPYPMLHCLRETSVSRAVDSHPNVHGIPQQNQAQLQALGYEFLRDRLRVLQETQD